MTFSDKIEDEIKEFVNKTENIYYFPDSNYGVEYLNNNFSVLGTKIDLSKEKNYISYDFKKNDFSDMVKFFEFLFENVPEHHYFFDEDKRWCLLIATEGWITYGEKSNKNNI